MNTFATEIVPLHDFGAWDTLVDAQAHGRVFVSRRWATVLEDVFGLQPYSAACLEGGELIGGLFFTVRKRGLFRFCTPPPLSLYNSLLLAPATAEPDAKERRKSIAKSCLLAVERFCHSVSVVVDPLPETFDVFRTHSWRMNIFDTLLIDVSDYERTRARYSRSLQQRIRRAEKHRLVFMPDGDPDVLLSLCCRSYERHGIAPPIPASRLVRWVRALREAGLGRIYTATLSSGDPIAARFIAKDGTILYDCIAGADIPAHDVSASHWLVDAILRRAAEEGFTTFDFLGVNTPGIADFKRAFGGEIKSYHHATRVRSPLVRAFLAVKNATVKRIRGMP
ncbi:MAG: GNAT family N-acetyltransferase [Bacteroidota bacterium]|nr:GNAT family N-acetyltransferase [Bacteroidota bacterium]